MIVDKTGFSDAFELTPIADAQARGSFVMLRVVALDEPKRLPGHVAEGGHAAPPTRILARYPRTLTHLARSWAWPTPP